jgi:hypothetical protein
VILLKQELVSFPKHLSSPTVFCWVRVAQSLVFCVVISSKQIQTYIKLSTHDAFLDYCLTFFFWPLYCMSVDLYYCFTFYSWHQKNKIHIRTTLHDQFLNIFDLIWFIVFNATFSNISAISWRPVLVVEEAGVPGESHRPRASNW